MGERRIAYSILVGKAENHLKDLGVDGMIILKLIVNRLQWIDVARGRDKWRAFVNTAVNRLVQ
jgi:hypothetical protein